MKKEIWFKTTNEYIHFLTSRICCMSPVLKWRSNWFKRFQSKELTSSFFDVLKKQLCLCWQHKTIGWYRLAFKSCKIGYHYIITQNYWFEELGHTSIGGGTNWEKTGRSKTPPQNKPSNRSCFFGFGFTVTSSVYMYTKTASYSLVNVQFTTLLNTPSKKIKLEHVMQIVLHYYEQRIV